MKKPRIHGGSNFRRLDVYRLALLLAVRLESILEGMPRGNRELASQSRRASQGVLLNVAEGASRRSRGLKRQSYQLALGEAGELVGALDLLLIRRLCSQEAYDEASALADRVCAMLYRLVERFSDG